MALTPEQLDRLAARQTIDITTTGRRTGNPRRIEIWWFRVEGRFIITGTPGRRDWVANLTANPALTVHVDGMELSARAVMVDDPEFRERVFSHPETRWYKSQAELQRLVKQAPMIEVLFDEG
jgi:deazaflavin-dependent oxidoreductase (nitroreductase family)